MPDRLHEALVYKAHGMHPIPFYAHSKTPAFAEGEIYQYRERAPSVDELKRWFKNPDLNIGLITGVNGLHILDVDGDIGRHSLKRLPELGLQALLAVNLRFSHFSHSTLQRLELCVDNKNTEIQRYRVFDGPDTTMLIHENMRMW